MLLDERPTRRDFGDELRWGRDELRGMRDDVSSIVDDLRLLAQKELELARAEVAESIGLSRRTLIFGGIAAGTALLMFVFAATALMFALDIIMPQWAAALVTTATLAGVATLAGFIAMQAARRSTS